MLPQVQAATNGAYMATRQMLACGGVRVLGDTTRLSEAGFTFHPQQFLTYAPAHVMRRSSVLRPQERAGSEEGR